VGLGQRPQRRPHDAARNVPENPAGHSRFGESQLFSLETHKNGLNPDVSASGKMFLTPDNGKVLVLLSSSRCFALSRTEFHQSDLHTHGL
jgi:hypothetical protein